MSVLIERATIIGDGAMGTVCGLLLARQGIQVAMWGFFPEQIADIQSHRENRRFLPGHALPDNFQATADPAQAFAATDLIVNAVPCQYIRNVWGQFAGHCPPGARVVSVAKGIEIETLLRPTQIISELVGKVTVGVLSGPSIAPEVAAGMPATVVAASDDLALADLCQDVFSTGHFRVYTNPDLIGVELAGATKNVIALAAGIIDGIEAGDNAKAALLTRGLVEITRLGVAMGAQADTFKGLAGIGDLVTTCISPLGRNRTAGEKIGRGMPVPDVIASSPSVVEGIPTTQSVLALAHQYLVDMPITSAVYSVLFEHSSPADAIESLMCRQLRPE
ncbi:MAG TPA: NAD(P)H-dependent glycerol-3-phosphate dehydrogenase [Phycisphaerae bacterium]|nr:NAD(P)H-dependent glycerol-3-phosphate dehydrogenase [Phycisphaerae bacterium]